MITPEHPASWEAEVVMAVHQVQDLRVVHTLPGRYRFYLPAHLAPAGQRIAARLRATRGVRSVQFNPLTSTMLILTDPEGLGAEKLWVFLTESVDDVMRAPISLPRDRHGPRAGRHPVPGRPLPRHAGTGMLPPLQLPSRTPGTTPQGLGWPEPCSRNGARWKSPSRRISRGIVRLAAWLPRLPAWPLTYPEAPVAYAAEPFGLLKGLDALARLPLTALVLRTLLGQRQAQMVLGAAAVLRFLLAGSLTPKD